MTVAPGTRLAVVAATPPFHVRLRAQFGLAPGPEGSEPPRGLAYCGAEYRAYPSMRIGDAVRFYAAIHARFDSERLAADFAIARLDRSFEIRRMKRAYQRALVLALAAASLPSLLVVENGEEFDEAPAAALLAHAVMRNETALVTFGGEARPEPVDTYTDVVSASLWDSRVAG